MPLCFFSIFFMFFFSASSLWSYAFCLFSSTFHIFWLTTFHLFHIFVVVRFDVETAGWRHFCSGGTALSGRIFPKIWNEILGKTQHCNIRKTITLQIKSRALKWDTDLKWQEFVFCNKDIGIEVQLRVTNSIWDDLEIKMICRYCDSFNSFSFIVLSLSCWAISS